MDKIEKISNKFKEKICDSGALVAVMSKNNLFSHSESGIFPDSGLIIHIIVLRGSMNLTVDEVKYECNKTHNNLVTIKPMNTPGQIIMDDDFSGKLIILTKQFMSLADSGKRPVSIADLIIQRNNVTSTRTRREINLLSQYFDIIMNEHVAENSSYIDTIIFRHAVLLYHLKITKMSLSINRFRLMSRTSVLFDKFYRLMEDNIEKQHNVSFYADKLCITPHYLTMISKSNTGKSAIKLIAEELVRKATLLLYDENKSIKEISEQLNFSDQSSFGTFFKKHTGKSPVSFRKGLCH